jgi:glycopeptide antibiotics resistance protein
MDFSQAKLIVDASIILFFGLIWLSLVVYLRLNKKKSLIYLLFFTIFYIYIVKVLDYTLFQFQSLILLKHFVPTLMLNGAPFNEGLNLIPLITLDGADMKTSLLNILLFIPFGFGLPFITTFRFKNVVIYGLVFSLIIELLQFLTGLIANMTFRIADINDLIFNTIGTAIGYALFLMFIRVYREVFPVTLFTNPVLRYIAERPQK